MIVTLIALLIGAFSLHIQISPIIYARIVAVTLFLSSLITFNSLAYIQLSDGLGIFTGLFHVSFLSLTGEWIIYLTASFILIPWFIAPLPKNIAASSVNTKVSNSLPNINEKRFISEENYLKLNRLSGPICSDYSLILLFSVLGATLLISSSDLISMYLSIELQSFAVYILSTLYKNNELAVSSGLKYFLLGGLSSCFILLGAGLLYKYTGLTNIQSIFSLLLSSNNLFPLGNPFNLSSPEDTTSIVAVVGLLFLVIGFLFKIAAAPLHNWAPDVYDGVPTIVTTWLTIMPKLSIIIFLLELTSITVLGSNITDLLLYNEIGKVSYLNSALKNLLLISSLLSLVIGSIVGLAQFKIKRLLAYSTISHIGFLLLALAINSESSTESLLFYLIQYTFSNLNVFLILLAFGYILKSNGIIRITDSLRKDNSILDLKYIYELKGQFIVNPLLSLSFSLMLFSMAGVPPLLGFFAKQQVLLAATYNGYYFMSVLAILVSVVSAYYYLQIIKVMLFSTNVTLNPLNSHAAPQLNKIFPLGKEPNEIHRSFNPVIISNIHSYLISVLTLGILLFILDPNLLLNSVHLLGLSLFSS